MSTGSVQDQYRIGGGVAEEIRRRQRQVAREKPQETGPHRMFAMIGAPNFYFKWIVIYSTTPAVSVPAKKETR